MRRRRNKKKRGLTIALILLLAVAAASGYILINSYGGLSWLKPADQTNSAVQTGSASTSTAGNTTPGEGTTGENIAGSSTGTAGNSGTADPIQVQINDMSLEEKVGQLVVAGIDGYQNDEHSKELMEKYHVGGFIFFKTNIQNSSQLLDLLNSLKQTNAAADNIPLFLSVDEEGGRVSRLPDEFKKFPTNKVIGKRNDSALSNSIGSILGEELSAFGFNVDFAPVLDINSNPDNPVIGDRSFGATSELVSKLGVATMEGIQSQNVVSVVKHFPGHGDTSVDSHIGLPVVNHDLKRLKSFELKPFAAAIDDGADAVMVAHILFPKLDAKNPASFSKPIITDILRNDMGFDGVVITDDFTMGAIEKNYNMGAAAVKSIQAGGDIVLVCHGFEKQQEVINALLTAAKNGELTEERINQSLYRILKLKQKYSLADEPAGPVNVQSINKKITDLGF